MNEARPALQAGALLAGRWQITEFIGSGQLAEVYGVHDTHGGADHALKLFSAPGLTRPEVWSAFQSAVRAVSAAGNEGVARASDFGIDANSGRPFCVSERVSWKSLGQRVEAHGPISAEALGTGLLVIARAIDAAHAAAVVHRNLKPENVFISPDNPGWARITDFGVGILRSASPPPPGWAAELGWHSADGADPAQRPAPAMDIYQLGLVCFFALTGKSPFFSMQRTPADPNQLWRELGEPLGPLSARASELGASLNRAFDPWFSRALALAPSDRFGKAAEMAEAFVAIAKSGLATARSSPDPLPGIAAAIPQPLVFQPEPPKSSRLVEGPAPHAVPAAATAANAGGFEPHDLPPAKKSRLTAQLFIGGAVLCFALTAAGAYALYRVRSQAEPEPAATAQSSAPAPPLAAPPAPAATPEPAPSAEPKPAMAKVRFACIPGVCEWVVCDGKNIRGLDKEVDLAPGEHACSASRYGFGSKALIFTAKAGESSVIEFELPPLPEVAAKKAAATPAPSVTPAKTPAPKKSAPKAAAKPAAAAPAKSKATTKPTTASTAKSGAKKKCGTFINPCK